MIEYIKNLIKKQTNIFLKSRSLSACPPDPGHPWAPALDGSGLGGTAIQHTSHGEPRELWGQASLSLGTPQGVNELITHPSYCEITLKLLTDLNWQMNKTYI